MHPVCFYLGSRPIYWFGVCVAVAFLAVMGYWSWVARREHRAPGFASDLAFWIMLGGILGGRLAYVAANYPEYLAHPLSILRIDQGGLIFYGGFVGGVLAVVLFARVRGLPLWDLGDLVLSGLPLGHGLGRVGCFMNGCCYGQPSDAPWAVFMAGARRHPTQLYEAVFNLGLFVVLALAYPRRRRPGTVVALYLMIYPVGRFLLEYFRGDERQHLFEFATAQVISLVLFAAGAGLWWWLPWGGQEANHEPSAGSAGSRRPAP